MVKSLNFTKTEAGLLGTVFFWTYAVGQLINGNLGDRIKSRKFIFMGLVSAAVINIMIFFSSNYFFILILWAANGYFLSTLWGPIIKTLSLWFTNKKRTKMAVAISTSMIAGFFVSWGLVGQIIAYTSWRWAFLIPGIIVFTYSFIWLWKIRNRPAEVGLDSPNKLVKKDGNKENTDKKAFLGILRVVIDYKLWIIAISCLSLGIVREGIILWGPTYLSEVYQISPGYVSAFSLFIPGFSLAGILASGYINLKLKQKDERAVMIFMSGTAFTFLILSMIMGVNIFLDAILLGIGVGLLFGANTLLLGVIPMNFAGENKVSGVAGFLDFSTYVGAAAGGVLAGYIVDIFNWHLVILLWSMFAIIGVVSLIVKPEV